MDMKTSLRGMIEIASHEGIVLSPYRDSVGVLTWGIGHTRAAGPPDPHTLPMGENQPIEMAFSVFKRDLEKYEGHVRRLIQAPLSQHQFDALVSFTYNVGPGNLAKSKLRKSLNAGDYVAAARHFMGWKKPREIVPRRRKEQKLFRDGIYSAKGYATVYRANAAGKVLWKTGRKVNVAEILATGLAPVDGDGAAAPPMGVGALPFKRPSARLLAGLLAAIAALVGGLFTLN